ncbi:MAG TPA: hypothetical protein DCL61_07665, partial [Cyanobacteria bacterium UBA12227]|nr:hypothetical protein [Cyanobacteria bacterium UBA12227]
MINSLFERVKKSIQFRYNGLVEKILWSNLNLQWQLKSGINIKVATYAEWVIYNDIFVDGEYDLSLQKSLSNLKPYQSFILLDIGANVGYFTL